jgi:hypothetical protein
VCGTTTSKLPISSNFVTTQQQQNVAQLLCSDSLNNETRIILWTMNSPLEKDIILRHFFAEEKVSSAVKFEWSNQEDEKKVKTQNMKPSSCSLLGFCTHT